MRTTYRYNAATDRMEEVWNNSEKLEGKVHIQGDITPFLSPIDGTIISCRGGLRRHMTKHGVTNSDDYTQSRDKRREDRDLLARQMHPSQIAERKRAVSDACEHVRNQKIADGSWKN